MDNPIDSRALHLVINVERALSNNSNMNSTEIFNLAYKLEEAQRILLTLAERLRKDEDKSKTIDLINGVPF